MQEQQGFYLKQVTSDHLPLQAGKYQLFGKYDFNIPEKAAPEDPDTMLHIKVDAPADRYMLNYMRIKVIDKAPVKTADQ